MTLHSQKSLAPDVELLAKDHPDYVAALTQNRRWNYAANLLDSSTFAITKASLTEITILPFFISQLTQNAVIIGLTPAISWLGFSLPQLFGAYFVHSSIRHKPFIVLMGWLERVAILGMFLMTLTIGLLPATVVLAGFLATYCGFCSTAGLLTPPYSNFYAKHIPSGRGLFLGVQTVIYGALGVVGAELVRMQLSASVFPYNMQSVLGWAFVLSLPAMIAFHGLREVPSPIVGPPQSFVTYLRAIPALLRENPALKQLLKIRSLLALGKLSVPFLAVYAIERFHLEAGYVATYTAIMLGSQSVSALAWGFFADRLNYRWLWLCSAVIVLVQAVLALVAPSATWFIVIFLLIGLNLGAESAALPHTLYSVSPPAETTRVIGLTNTVLAPILAAGPVIGGVLINQFSYTAALLAAVIVAAIGVAGTLVWIVPQLAANRRHS